MDLEGYPKYLPLKGEEQVIIRPLKATDEAGLLDFFSVLPEQDRLFLREDVTRPEVIQGFVQNIDFDSVMPLLAEHEGKIVGDATLHLTRHGWTRHVGQIRMVVARKFQHRGLGTAMARCLVRHAVSLGLDKLLAEVVDNQIAAKRAFEKLGFKQEAVLRNQVRDIHGVKRNLVILSNDVSHIWETMEAMVADFSPTYGG
ncbi:MAG: GNAT family N-acetyltransferase [Deltaproteobacteria bacterium]|nr:GNAT family N-acetyltransferase [Deltaproteobacteria bacterium]